MIMRYRYCTFLEKENPESKGVLRERAYLHERIKW